MTLTHKKIKILTALFLTVLLILMTGCSAGSSSVQENESSGTSSPAEAADFSSDAAAVQEMSSSGDTSEAESSAAVSPEASGEKADSSSVTVRIGALSGPTAMGLVKLMDDSEKGETGNLYEFAELSTDASAFAAPLAKGEIDIAALPSNLASVIYNNTDGGIKVLAAAVGSVLSIVERGSRITSLTDLAGKTLYATGQGAVPEAVLRNLLIGNGMDPDTDLTIHWCSDTTEALSYVTKDPEAIAMLPQPFVTAALSKVDDLRIALDLAEEWQKLDTGCDIVTGVIVARTAFIEEHPEEVRTFMAEYEASSAYALSNTSDTATLIEKYGIVSSAALAEKALPKCGLECLTGDVMKKTVSGFLEALSETNPKLIGTQLPDGDFYYD